MLTSKKSTLRPIMESSGGIHLSAYLVNRGDLVDLKAQIQEIINQSYEHLIPILTLRERNKFLSPLDSLLLDARIFKKMKGNIGIFRNKDSFVVINLPIEVETFFQVASTFHVKPLLKWLQLDQEFLFLGFKKDSAHLYAGTQDSFKLIDSIVLPEFFDKKELAQINLTSHQWSQLKVKESETIAWLNEWVHELTKNSSPKLFFAGESFIVEEINQKIKYNYLISTPVANSFGDHNLIEICASIRKILKVHSKKCIEKALKEFRFAEEENRSCSNIFQISKAVVEGRVQKLIITDDINVFGSIDKTTGFLSIHPFDLDHEDDDVLDDLAQMVINQGGEVVIASRKETPKSLPILAILDATQEPVEKTEKLHASIQPHLKQRNL